MDLLAFLRGRTTGGETRLGFHTTNNTNDSALGFLFGGVRGGDGVERAAAPSAAAAEAQSDLLVLSAPAAHAALLLQQHVLIQKQLLLLLLLVWSG